MLNSQTDGSSFPNGGLRATHTAAAFITIDPESPPFILGDVVYLPSVVAAYSGVSLDEKTPLHRSHQALSKEARGPPQHAPHIRPASALPLSPST